MLFFTETVIVRVLILAIPIKGSLSKAWGVKAYGMQVDGNGYSSLEHKYPLNHSTYGAFFAISHVGMKNNWLY